MPAHVICEEIVIKPTENHFTILEIKNRVIGDTQEVVETKNYAFANFGEAVVMMKKALGEL